MKTIIFALLFLSACKEKKVPSIMTAVGHRMDGGNYILCDLGKCAIYNPHPWETDAEAFEKTFEILRDSF